MAFYIIGPIEGLGSVKEPLMAVGISVISGESTELSILFAIQRREVEILFS